MARIAGVDLPKDKRIEIGLTYVYGIGRTSAKKILEMTGINPDTRVKDLTDEEEAKIRECIDHHFIVEGDLRRSVALDIKRLTEIGCYRGLRHRKASVTDAACPCAASAARPMRVPARARNARSPIRRSKGGICNGKRSKRQESSHAPQRA